MCSGYYNGTDLVGIYLQELDIYDYPRADGYICPDGLVCLQVTGSNPEYGFLNMDNLYFSLLNLFTVVSLEGWTDMMYDAQDGESSSSAAFFCLAVYILSFIMIPLFIGNHVQVEQLSVAFLLIIFQYLCQISRYYYVLCSGAV
jgi:hypothetical protein